MNVQIKEGYHKRDEPQFLDNNDEVAMAVVRNLIVPCRNAIVKLIIFTEWISEASLANGYANLALWSSFILFKK